MTELLWLLTIGIPLIGYAEIHFRIPLLPSRLFRREPEIIFDMPVRTEPDGKLPVFLLINDAHLFPIQISSVTFTCYHSLLDVRENFYFNVDAEISSNYYEQIFPILLTQSGKWEISAELIGKNRNKSFHAVSDNYRSTSKKPFTVWVSSEPFPKFLNQQHGDLHHHTRYTFDQVEFGGGIPLSKSAANVLGYDFLCLTDHSYDLDDLPDNYLKQDPELEKWKQFNKEVSELNGQKDGTLLIPGFELSTGNQSGENVHLLLLGQTTFIHGSGDGGEIPFKTKPETTLSEALGRLDPQTTAFAAHPFETPSTPEKLTLNRGIYTEHDLLTTQIPLQILNGWLGEAFQKSRQIWIRFLLAGNRTLIGGGNDSHGNFNRVRQIKLPFFSITEKDSHWFGKFRTVVQSQEKNEQSILSALKAGHSYLTNGIALLLKTKKIPDFLFGSELVVERFKTIVLKTKTTGEFGSIEEVRIYFGTNRQEIEVRVNVPEENCLDFELDFSGIRLPEGSLYFRIEVEGKLGDFYYQRSQDPLIAFTNPVFLV